MACDSYLNRFTVVPLPRNQIAELRLMPRQRSAQPAYQYHVSGQARVILKVDAETIEKTLPLLSSTVAAVVRLQLATSMRPSELFWNRSKITSAIVSTEYGNSTRGFAMSTFYDAGNRHKLPMTPAANSNFCDRCPYRTHRRNNQHPLPNRHFSPRLLRMLLNRFQSFSSLETIANT